MVFTAGYSKKKDNSWHFCVDYCKLNSVTHHDAYSLLRIDATLDYLSDLSLFTTLDLASGYWQFEVAEADKEKTAFFTPQRHFEFNVMPLASQTPHPLSRGSWSVPSYLNSERLPVR